MRCENGPKEIINYDYILLLLLLLITILTASLFGGVYLFEIGRVHTWEFFDGFNPYVYEYARQNAILT